MEYFGAIMVGLSGGGGMRMYNLKFKIVWSEYLWVATSPCGGLGVLPQENMKYEVL